jgi:hypothetical protein
MEEWKMSPTRPPTWRSLAAITPRGDSAFAQVQGVYLAECGTHAVVDAGFRPCHTGERHGGFCLLRSVGPGMLLMWDRGFHDFDMVAQAQAGRCDPGNLCLLIAHYMIRCLMQHAACHSQLDPDRLSFVHALELLRDAIAEFPMTAPQFLADLSQRLWRDIARHPLPKRRHRTNPRVVKRKMSNFPLKRPQHTRWPQPSMVAALR